MYPANRTWGMVATGWTSSVYCIKELQAVNVRAKHVSQHVILLYDFDASHVGDSSVFCDFDAKEGQVR